MNEEIIIEDENPIDEDFIDTETLIESMKGFDEDNLANTSVAIVLEKWTKEGETVRQMALSATRKADVQVERHGAYIQLKMIFESNIDKDLNIFWQTLETFGSELDKIDDNTTEIPILIFSLVPEKYDGDYYVTAMNPIFWNIQSKKPSSTYNNELRVLFLAEQFLFYKTDEIDVKEIENAVEREAGYRLNLEVQESLKQQKEEEQYEKRHELEEIEKIL